MTIYIVLVEGWPVPNDGIRPPEVDGLRAAAHDRNHPSTGKLIDYSLPSSLYEFIIGGIDRISLVH